MTRGAVVESPGDPGFVLRNPHPIGATLPGVYRDAWHEDELLTGRSPFGPRFVSAFDAVLSPVLMTLDNLEAYFDVNTAPEDFLPWLGQWVGASIDDSWSEDRRRRFIGEAAELFRRRGTAAGLRDHLQIYTDGVVEVRETGGSSWSLEPDGPMPGKSQPVVVILVSVDDPKKVNAARLDAVIRASKPAHVAHRLQILETAPADGRKRRSSAGGDAVVGDGSSAVDGAAAADGEGKPPA